MATNDLQKAWYSRFDLILNSRDPTTGRISAVNCKLCLIFGREKTHIKTINVFKAPFRTENFQCHLQNQHTEKWAEYEMLESGRKKKAFFEIEVPYAETIESHFGRAEDALFVTVPRENFQGILCPFFVDEYGEK